MLYVDYNATAPLYPEAKAKMEPFLSTSFGNPSSVHYSLGRNARDAIELARFQVADLLGAEPRNVKFLSGGTESCFSAILGVFTAKHPKKHLIISSVEHAAVLETAKYLSTESFGASVTQIPVKSSGELDELALKSALNQKNTALVSIMMANNETGVLFDIKKVLKICKNYGAILHTDAVQAAGKVSLNFLELGADLLSVSAHKIGGPKGIGALLIKDGTPFLAPMKAGGQEGGFRGGTSAVAQIVGFGEAAEITKTLLSSNVLSELEKAKLDFENKILSNMSSAKVNGSGQKRLANTTSLSIPGLLANDFVLNLGKQEIMFSAGSACSASEPHPSHVLQAMGLSTNECLSTIRLSFGSKISKEELNTLSSILIDEINKAKEASSDFLKTRLKDTVGK